MLRPWHENPNAFHSTASPGADVIAARPLKDLVAKWGASDDAAVAFTKMVYNSFKRS
jgi:hypothetical protein